MKEFLMKIAMLLCILLLLFFAPGNAAAEGTNIINTEKNTLHRPVFTMPVYMVLPEGCSFIETQAGCADKAKKISFEGSVLRLPYAELLQEFNGENLKKANMELKMRSEFIWNGSPAMLMKIFQKNGASIVGKWTLIVDRGKESWMINGLYPANDQKRGETVLNILKSSYWESEKNTRTAEVPLGRVEVAGTPLKLAGLIDGAVVYTKDGLLPTKNEDRSIFVISKLSNTFVTAEKQSGFAKERLQNIEKGEKIDVISENQVNIDGLNGVEIVGYTGGKEKKLIFQTMLFDSINSHVMVGIARSEIPDNLSLFHSMAETFKRAR